ncbi:MAG: hypothetical protein ABI599_11815 [Flavobacteriales bacterium]
MLGPAVRRNLILAGIVVIMVCCTASAILGLRSGNTARAFSTFFAGLAFSLIFWTRRPRK